ncbi:MAG: RNA polymerase subunit sigma-70 [Acidobacteria bacterium]|nr:RNA polymerase subunit sigma-70 [Acidobacteriota bacterium]
MAEEISAESLLPLVYDELRALAARYLRRERPGGTLQPTALVHEAYLRLMRSRRLDVHGRNHFYALAAIQMRRILVERARAAASVKRGGNLRRVTLADGMSAAPDGSVELLALDEALTRLAQRNARQGQISDMRLFGGMGAAEIASHLGISERTAREDWRVARAWLMKELSPGKSSA